MLSSSDRQTLEWKINENKAGRTRSTKGTKKNGSKMLFEKIGRIQLKRKFIPIRVSFCCSCNKLGIWAGYFCS